MSSVDDFKLNHKATNTSMYSAISDTSVNGAIAFDCCRSLPSLSLQNRHAFTATEDTTVAKAKTCLLVKLAANKIL